MPTRIEVGKLFDERLVGDVETEDGESGGFEYEQSGFMKRIQMVWDRS